MDTEIESNHGDIEESIDEKYNKSKETIQILMKKIKYLEKDLKDKNEVIEEMQESMDDSEEAMLINNKKSGFKRQGPQVESMKRRTKTKFECKRCDIVFES